MTFRRTPALALAGLLAAAVPSAGHAAPQIFFGEDLNVSEAAPVAARPNADAARAGFLGQLVGVGTETFESFSTGTGLPLNIVFPGAGTATLSGSGTVNTVTSGTSAGRYAISGSNFVATSDSMTIAFSSPVVAFGFFGTDIGDIGGQVTLTFGDGSATLVNIGNTTNNAGGSTLYFGYIDTAKPFTSITFGNTAAGSDVFGFDDFTIGSIEQVVAAPEPMTLGLFGLGLLGLGAIRRRR